MPTARFSTAKDQHIYVVCDSSSIVTGDISEVLSTLKSLSGDRSSAMSAEGTVTLVFNGYDDDPRELESIPEVREWFAKLFKAWPYWSFFASRIDQTVPLVLTLLLPGETVAGEPGMVGWEFDSEALKPLLFQVFAHQNELVDRLEIGEDVNERVSADYLHGNEFEQLCEQAADDMANTHAQASAVFTKMLPQLPGLTVTAGHGKEEASTVLVQLA